MKKRRVARELKEFNGAYGPMVLGGLKSIYCMKKKRKRKKVEDYI